MPAPTMKGTLPAHMTSPTYQLHHGDALQLLQQIQTPVHAVITDPPYSATRMGEATSTKRYFTDQSNTARRLPPIAGETMDQHAYMNWTREWVSQATNPLTDGGIIGAFTNHAMLAPMIDAIQQAGITYRGIVVWHKPINRPQRGRYSNACEYFVWGTKGQRNHKTGNIVKGFYSESAPYRAKRLHQTEKPLGLMQHLISVTNEGETILDPFCGSGTTLLAAITTGRNAIGIEKEEAYCELAAQRLEHHQPALI